MPELSQIGRRRGLAGARWTLRQNCEIGRGELFSPHFFSLCLCVTCVGRAEVNRDKRPRLWRPKSSAEPEEEAPPASNSGGGQGRRGSAVCSPHHGDPPHEVWRAEAVGIDRSNLLRPSSAASGRSGVAAPTVRQGCHAAPPYWTTGRGCPPSSGGAAKRPMIGRQPRPIIGRHVAAVGVTRGVRLPSSHPSP